MADLSVEFDGRAKIGNVNVDSETPLAKQWAVTAIPSILVFKDGKQVDQIQGMPRKEELRVILNKYVDPVAQTTAIQNADAAVKK